MVILGRLSYTIYLVNTTVILMMDGMQRTAITPTLDYMVSMEIKRIETHSEESWAVRLHSNIFHFIVFKILLMN